MSYIDYPIRYTKHWYASYHDKCYQFSSPVARDDFCAHKGATPISSKIRRSGYEVKPRYDDKLDRTYYSSKG